MPHKFCFLTVVFLINRLPSKVINYDTPLQRLFYHDPDYSSLLTFGCACWPNLRRITPRSLLSVPFSVCS
jgi:histone deacetylase 1/2